MPTDNHDLGKNALGGTPPHSDVTTGSPGYEISDVNVNGVIVFLSGLLGFVFVFFIFCFIMGRVINHEFLREDGPPTKWQRETPAGTGKRENLASNPEMDQKQLQRMVAIFPTPRLDVDDGNQATADLHAKEDLLLDHYSTIGGQPEGVRIPIDRAMALIVQRQLPVSTSFQQASPSPSNEIQPVQAPLTTGFARTGYELDTIEAREQKLSYTKAAGEGKAADAQPR